MYFRGKPLDDVTWEDIEELREGEVQEDTFLEYKESLPGRSDSDKKEFLADVTAFANKAGGTIIYGVVEKRDDEGKSTGKIGALTGIGETNSDQEIARLESIIRTGTQPTLSGIRFKVVSHSDSVLLLIKIGRGVAGPYTVSFQASGKFFTRTSTGKVQMDVYEVRRAFLESEDWIKQAEAFRQQRVHDVWFEDVVSGLNRRPSFFVHMLPLGSNRAKWELPLLLEKTRDLGVLMYGPWRESYHVDGVRRSNGSVHTNSYIHCFRDVAIELFMSAPMELGRINGQQVDVIDGKAIESHVQRFLLAARQSYLNLEMVGPHYCCITIVACTGYYMFHNRDWIRDMDSDHRAFDRELISIAGSVIEATHFDLVEAPKRLYDHLWQAAGWPESPNTKIRHRLLTELAPSTGIEVELRQAHPELFVKKQG